MVESNINTIETKNVFASVNFVLVSKQMFNNCSY